MRAQLIGDITARLAPGVRPPFLHLPSRLPDLFESFVFTIVVEAALLEGGMFAGLRNTTGASAASTLFRTSPGTIFTRANHGVHQHYTHVIIDFPDAPSVEIHQGIYVTGRSRSSHECDVVVVEHDEAETCRQNNAHPRSSKIVLAAECKFYGRNLGIAATRGFMGLTSDIWVQDRFLVSNTTLVVKGLLRHHKRKWSENLTPMNAHGINQFRSLVGKVFEEYKAEF